MSPRSWVRAPHVTTFFCQTKTQKSHDFGSINLWAHATLSVAQIFVACKRQHLCVTYCVLYARDLHVSKPSREKIDNPLIAHISEILASAFEGMCQWVNFGSEDSLVATNLNKFDLNKIVERTLKNEIK